MTTGAIFQSLCQTSDMSLLPGVTVRPSAIWSCLKFLSLRRRHKLLEFWEVRSSYGTIWSTFLPQGYFAWSVVWSAWVWACACRNRNRCVTWCSRESTKTPIYSCIDAAFFNTSLKRSFKSWFVSFIATCWQWWVSRMSKVSGRRNAIHRLPLNCISDECQWSTWNSACQHLSLVSLALTRWDRYLGCHASVACNFDGQNLFW